jgi:hypothetical protein
MKRSIIKFALCVSAAFVMAGSSQKESYEPAQESSEYAALEVPVSLPADTKTYNDGLSTKWSVDDQLSLSVRYYSLIQWGYVTEVADNPFNHAGKGKFVGKLEREIIMGAMNALSSTFTVAYPYGSQGIPASTTQNGYDSKAHLAGPNCPLSGKINLSLSQDWEGLLSGDRVYTLPEVKLEHTTSVVEVAVVNNTAAAVNVSEVALFVDGAVKATTVVENGGALAAGETAMVYVVVEPATYAGSQLSFKVNNSFEKKITAEEVTFTAGKIKKVNFELK